VQRRQRPSSIRAIGRRTRIGVVTTDVLWNT
jgi:hypothetical protein